ncbi:MAG: isoprenyl transferase [Clostridiales bacterium]|jgi:undecaprenyl diphosphate synthase|nr:isoprenyl transferase [Clostridiales bacterium]
MKKPQIDFSDLPRHIAIIMDGNGRWAKKYFMKREAGHRAGAQALRRLVEQMNEAGFKILTVFAFSTENWKRDEGEVAYLMGLIHEYIQQYIDDAHKNNVRMRAIGDLNALEPSLQAKIADLTEMTKDKDGLLLNIAINYGGRDEILRAARALARHVADGKINPASIDELVFTNHLDTGKLPDPDLIIRTSGEMRLSNFLLWQAAYSEFHATDTLWPDFKINHLYEAVAQFQKRERRFGGRL